MSLTKEEKLSVVNFIKSVEKYKYKSDENYYNEIDDNKFNKICEIGSSKFFLEIVFINVVWGLLQSTPGG